MKKDYRKRHHNSIKEILFRVVIGIIAALCTGCCLWCYIISGKFLPTRELLTGHASIHFIDVGQGDATLVMTGTHAVLIDTGTSGSADTLVTYLQTYIRKIDYLILTHPHDDHTGGTQKVLASFTVENVIAPDIPNDGYYAQLQKMAQNYGFQLHSPQVGKTYETGDINFTILGPVRTDYENINDVSIATRVEVDGVSLLCSGDAEYSAESDILSQNGVDLLNCDLYQVGHHGSSTSTSLEFYYAVSPNICVISCGSGNSYGHPHSTVLSLLELGGAEVYRTDLNGTIVFDTDGESVKRRLW